MDSVYTEKIGEFSYISLSFSLIKLKSIPLRPKYEVLTLKESFRTNFVAMFLHLNSRLEFFWAVLNLSHLLFLVLFFLCPVSLYFIFMPLYDRYLSCLDCCWARGIVEINAHSGR
jgi:hypothetical protein